MDGPQQIGFGRGILLMGIPFCYIQPAKNPMTSLSTITTFLQISWLKTTSAIKLLFKGNKYWTKVFLRSLRYWRVVEFPYVLAQIRGKTRLQVLDISSPKILSMHMAGILGHDVTAIDIWDKEINMWKSVKESLALPPNLKFETQDATHLGYRDLSFDVVYSVSVIEHIDSTGDSTAMSEIARVLRSGGIAIVTTMFDKKGYDVWRRENVYHKQFSEDAVFYERWYNRAQIEERIIKPSGLEVVDISYAGEKYSRVHKRYLDRFISSSFLVSNSWSIVEPLVALLNLRYYSNSEEIEEGVALLTLRKP